VPRFESLKIASARLLPLIALASFGGLGFAQSVKVHGMIKSRSGPTMTVESAEAQSVVVLLTDYTAVGQTQGVLKARKKQMPMAALIPGLEVQVEGTYNTMNQLEAKSVKFNGDDLERAQSIQAGLHETQVQTEQHREELEKQSADLKAKAEELKKHQGQLSAQQRDIAANKANIDAAIARFGQLDDYYILDEVTVYYGNGKVALDSQYKPQLLKLAQNAKKVEGYMIQVVGYASSAGSAALNQKLSADRADGVVNFLTQEGDIPLTNLLAPGAMGESRQVGSDQGAEGEAQNRRVVVRVLQNKGIAGAQSLH
jgi:OmpA-OmpF porin, OOP family